MAEPHVLTGLIAKRAELAGQIEHAQDKLRQLAIDLDHIDAAIHIFDPGPWNKQQSIGWCKRCVRVCKS
jgi:hypothetical protein